MKGVSATHLVVLRAVAARKVSATSAGFEVDGKPAEGDLQRCLDVLWLEDLIDAELVFDEGAQPVVLTDAGKALVDGSSTN